MQNDTLVAVDIAKEVFEIGVSDRPGRVAMRRRLARSEFLEFFAQLRQVTVVMEACGSARYWARRIEELGHVVDALKPSLSSLCQEIVSLSTRIEEIEGNSRRWPSGSRW